MIPPLQIGIPGGPELVVLLFVLVFYVLLLIGALGGVGYFLLRIRSGGSVDERLERIERKVGGLEARVEDVDERVRTVESRE